MSPVVALRTTSPLWEIRPEPVEMPVPDVSVIVPIVPEPPPIVPEERIIDPAAFRVRFELLLPPAVVVLPHTKLSITVIFPG
jgi:hypothetical protein